MGRHRRSDAGRATAYESPHETSAYLFDHGAGLPDQRDVTGGSDVTGEPRGHRGGSRRRAKTATVRTGLLGTSAALAVGAVAMASGLLPGGSQFGLGTGTGDSGATVRADSAPGPDGIASFDPAERASEPVGRGTERPQGPSPTPSPTPPPTPSRTAAAQQPSAQPPAGDARDTAPAGAPTGSGGEADSGAGSGNGNGSGRDKAPAPARPAPSTPSGTADPGAGTAPADGTPSAAEARVLTLVNQERVRAGCRPVRADSQLAGLAEEFSEDMAERGFFSHTDPDGDSPWDRAEQAGVKGLGGENIARGQGGAEAVMEAWMNSPGHRANILNCDYKTLGVGAHFADGGPWWTQNFGF